MAMKNKLAWLYLFWVNFYFLNKIIGKIQDFFWVSSVNSTKFPIYFAKFHLNFFTLSTHIKRIASNEYLLFLFHYLMFMTFCQNILYH
jgi:hypothetical protein